MRTPFVDKLSVSVLVLGVNALIKKRLSHDARVFSFILFPLDCSWWLRRNIIQYAVTPRIPIAKVSTIY